MYCHADQLSAQHRPVSPRAHGRFRTWGTMGGGPSVDFPGTPGCMGAGMRVPVRLQRNTTGGEMHRERDFRDLELHRLMEYTSIEELTGRHRIVRELVAVRLDDRVLEVGCSTGFWVNLYLRQRAPFAVGVDIDREDVRRGLASARRAPNDGAMPSFLVASGESLPFVNDSFSLVYCMDVLEHVANPEFTALEMSR